MKKSRQRQIELPGLESEPTQAVASPRSPADCEFPGTPSTAQMGVDPTERPAEPVETEISGPKPGRQNGVRGRLPFADLPGVSCLARNDQSARRAHRRIFGFARDMMFLLDKKPDYLFAAFDTSGPTFRHELSTTYKENRSEMPDALRPQIGNIRRMTARAWNTGAGMRGVRSGRYSARRWHGRSSKPAAHATS